MGLTRSTFYAEPQVQPIQLNSLIPVHPKGCTPINGVISAAGKPERGRVPLCISCADAL